MLGWPCNKSEKSPLVSELLLTLGILHRWGHSFEHRLRIIVFFFFSFLVGWFHFAHWQKFIGAKEIFIESTKKEKESTQALKRVFSTQHVFLHSSTVRNGNHMESRREAMCNCRGRLTPMDFWQINEKSLLNYCLAHSLTPSVKVCRPRWGDVLASPVRRLYA